LLTAEDAKLERLKFAFLFRIAGVCWVNKQEKIYVIRKYEKLGAEISFTLLSLIFFH